MRAVVTGAANGLGRGLGLCLGELGASIVLSDIDEIALHDVECTLRARGFEAFGVPTDVAKEAQVHALAETAFVALNEIDAVFLNAGVTIRGDAWQLTDLDWRWVFDVNLFGVVNGIRAFVPRLIAQGYGKVVITCSNSALGTVGGIAPYISSKQAVLAVAETLQHDLRRLGSAVTVAAVLPGAIKSSMPEAFRHRQREYGPPEVTDEVVEQSRAFLERYGEEPAVVARRIIDRVFDGDPFYVLTDSRDLVMSEDRIGGIRTGILGIPATPGVHGGEL